MFWIKNKKNGYTPANPFLAHLYKSCSHPGVGVSVCVGVSFGVGVAQMFKFLVKVFMSLYLLKLLMDQVDTLHVGRYWSEVLCCTIMTHLSDLEVNVIGHRFY